MNFLEKVRTTFNKVTNVEVVTDVAEVKAFRRPDDSLPERVERLVAGEPLSGEGDGRDVNVIDKFNEAVKRYKSGPLSRKEALQCPTYKRAIDLLSNAVAGLLSQANPEKPSKQEVWRRMNMRGFSGMDNSFNFWQDAVGEMLIDSFFGELRGGVLSTDARNRKVIPRPTDVVIPRLMGDDGDMVEFLLTVGYDAYGDKVQRVVPWKDMLFLRRGNTKVRYTLSRYNRMGSGTLTDNLKPLASYRDLEVHIRKLLLLDRFERDYWDSPAAFKMGLLLLSSERGAGRSDEYGEDLLFLREMIARLEINSPLQFSSGGNMVAGNAGSIGIEAEAVNVFRDYDKSIHQLREDCETVIASFFGLNPSDLGSDAARSGTGASELSESSWRNGVWPIVLSCKAEIEMKLLGGEKLNVPFMSYFQSPQTIGKVSQACVGAMSVDEFREVVLGLPAMGGEEGQKVYMGSQFSSESGDSGEQETESANQDGVNMQLFG